MNGQADKQNTIVNIKTQFDVVTKIKNPNGYCREITNINNLKTVDTDKK